MADVPAADAPVTAIDLCPVPVADLSAEPGLNEVRLAWSPGVLPEPEADGVQPFAPAEEFVVRVSGGETRLVTTTDPRVAVSGLKNGVEYSFEVFAVTAGGRSEGEGPVSATPSTGMEGVVAGLIVEFAPGSDQAPGDASVPGEDRVSGVDLTVAEQVTDDAVLVELSEPVDLATAEQIAADLAADEQVAWAEPDQFLFTASADDWNLTGAYGVDAFVEPDATLAGDGAGSTVAVIDTGVTSHPGLESRLVSGYDFVSSPDQLMASRAPNAPPVAFDGDYVDEAALGAVGRDSNPQDPGDWRDVAPTRASSWHGTQIAGVVAAVAPGASIQPVRALSWRGGLLSDIAASITWASGGTVDGVPANENPSKVINMSFSVETTCPVALQDAIDGARERGSVMVAAAGNANDDAAKFAPGNCNGVLTVGSTTSEGTRADYSNYGPVVDVAAPGGDPTTPVPTITNTGTTGPGQPGTGSDYGTSVSAAHVSAAAAILATQNPSITPDEAYRALTGSDHVKEFANSSCDANPDYSCGTGILSLAQIATTASGDQDYSLKLDGTSQYAIGGPISLGGTSEATIEGWVKPTSACSSIQLVVRQEHGYSLYCTGGNWAFAFKSTANPSGQYNWVDKVTNVPIQQGVWQHVAVTRSSAGLLQFFMNGQVAYSTTDTLPWWDQTSEPVSLGVNLFPAPSDFFVGEIDEVRLYDTDQSASIATQMLEYGPTSTSGLLAYYDFNEGPVGTTGTGTVYNRASGATSATNLRTVNGPTYADIKQTTSSGNNTVVTFPRSYLTAAGGWRIPSGVSNASVLAVGGGGGGGGRIGGGGGGGGVTETPGVTITSGAPVPVVVGVGGLGGTAPASGYTGYAGGNGTASAFGASSGSVAASGGGGGAGSNTGNDAGSGATGGGASWLTSAGTGSAGGSGGASSTFLEAGGTVALAGGGGGANSAAAGGSAVSPNAGSGGAGKASSISGATQYYGGGGGGGIHTTETADKVPGQGGSGGGGSGAEMTNASINVGARGGAGTAGTGGGGGGASITSGESSAAVGGNGGSGVVIVSYATAASGTCAPDETQYTSGGTRYRVVAFKDTGSCTWTVPTGVTSIDYLVVGGGGGGATRAGGGGGAGAVVQSSASGLTGGQTVTMLIGTGGSGGPAGGAGSSADYGRDGAQTSLSGAITASAAGGGGGGWVTQAGRSGASGGGGGGGGAGGNATAGNVGGAGVSASCQSGSTTDWCGGGGGGSGGVGRDGDDSDNGRAGDGGPGTSASFLTPTVASMLGLGEALGSSVYFAAGGGGGIDVGGTPGTGGVGGGGAGAQGATPAAGGSANSGSGGGGSGYNSTSQGAGGSGGSGVVVLRYTVSSSAECAPQQYTYTSGGTPYTVVEFQGAGTCSWTPPTGVTSVDVLAVGGGGGGGAWVGAGGGGGGVASSGGVSVTPGTAVSVAVGAGGAGAMRGISTWTDGANGGASTFGSVSSVTAAGGGVGASNVQAAGTGASVSTGGGGAFATSYGAGTGTASGTNRAGGSASSDAQPHPTGGGAGAGGNGFNGSGSGSSWESGAGGVGLASAITGASVYYGGGGGGSAHGTWTSATSWDSSVVITPGAGGLGGGGVGGRVVTDVASSAVLGGSGTDGLGGGGGGAANFWQAGTTYTSTGGDGGDGVVMVSYSNTPATPNALSAIAGQESAALTWAAPDHAGTSVISGYSVQFDTSSSFASPTTVATGSTSPSYTVTGLTANTLYYFRVAAVNDSGTGAYTAGESARPFGAATQIVMVTQPVAAASGSVLSTQPAVRIADANGNTVTSDSTTSVTVTASGGTLAGTTTVTASNGIVTFSGLTFAALRSSTYTLTFSSSGLTSATSSSITPSAVGPLAQFAVTQTGGTTPLSSGSYSAGTYGYARVTAQDSAGNTVTNFSGTVSLFSDAWPSPVSATSFTSGVKDSVALYPRVAGSGFTVTATYTAGSITTNPASSTFTVTAGAANKLVVATAPVGGDSGADMSPQPVIHVTDIYGNRVTDSTASVTVSTPESAWKWPSGAGAYTDINNVAYANGTWVGVANSNRLAVSTDGGVSWTSGSILNPYQNANWLDVAFGGGLWTAVSSYGIYTSADLATWTQRDPAYMGSVAYGNGVWVVSSYASQARRSTDGITWSGGIGYTFDEVSFAEGEFWGRSGNSLSRSFDGLTWRTFGNSGMAGTIYEMAVGNGRVVLVGSAGVTVSLTTTSSWTTSAISGTWTSVGFGDGAFRAGSSLGNWMSSQDGINWTAPSLVTEVAGGTAPSLDAMAYGGGSWVTGGNTGGAAIMVDTASAPVVGGTTTVTAANGIATFTDLTWAGVPGTSYSMTFSSSGLTSVTSTASPSAVGALDVAQTTVTTSASSIAAGSGTTTVTVQLRDSAGNVVASTGQTVALTVSSGALSAVTDNGDGSYTATLTAAALQTIAVVRATVNGTSVASAASVSYTVGAAAAVEIVRQPVAGASGAVLSTQPQVKVVDANGNALTGQQYRVTVTSSGGTLGGSQASSGYDTSTTTGIASFTNLTFAGLTSTSYTLTFAYSGLTSATSDPIMPTGAGSATTIAAHAGNAQSATVGTAVATPPAVLVTDAGGNPKSGVSVTFAAGAGTTATGLTATTDANGIATVGSWTMGTTAGSRSLTATSASLTGSPVTFTATATPGAAATLVLTRTSVGTASGAAFTTQPIITLKDAYNNTLTNDSTTEVTASVSGGGAIVGDPSQGVTAGVVTFVGLGISGTAGSTYVVTYSSGAATPVTQNVTVTAGAAAQLVVSTAAAGASYGTAWTTQPVVEIQDSGGNRVVTDSSTVVTVAVSAGGTLSTTTSNSTSSGLASFSGVSLTGTPGAFTLTYSASGLTSATQSLALAQASQTITFNQPSAATYGDAPYSLYPTSDSTLPVTLSSNSTSTCTVASNAVTIVEAGTCSLTASQSGDANYTAAADVTRTFTVNKAAQATLSMTSSASATYGETISLAFAGGSGTGATVYQVDAGTCGISGTTLTPGDAGSLCQVSAIKAGDANYNSTQSSTQTITISKAAQTLAFTSSVPASPLPNGTYTPTVSAISSVTGSSSGVTPTIAASGTCTISSGTVTFNATGTCTLTATAVGPYTNFLAATSVTQVIAVGSLNQNISFTQPSNVSFGSSSVSMGATTSSTLTVSYALGAGTTNAACSVSSLGVVTILAVGTCEVTASQAGDAQYAAASDVSRAFQVVPALATAPTLTSASASSQSITVGFVAPGFTGGVGITAYRVVATPTGAGTTVTSTSCTSSPCPIAGLVNGTEYTVTVAAINAAGTGPASSASTALTPATAAFAVRNLAATPGDTFVDVRWDQPADLGGGTFTRYELSYRVAGQGAFGSTITIGSAATTTHRVTGLDNGTSYDFQVVTITSANGSAIPGNTAQVVQYPSTVPSVPRSLTVLASTATDVQFSWQAPLADGGSGLTSPNYTVTVTGSAGAAAVTCTPSGADTNCTATGLTNGASYDFAVVANNRMGSSVAATVTYNVPSSDATLSALELASSAGAVSLTPSFASGTTAYAATVTYAVESLEVTPTSTMAGSTIEVDGLAVTSGTASAAIPLAVGDTTIDVVVTASDVRFSETYTVTITRSPAPSNGGGGGSSREEQAKVPVTPPASVLSGGEPGAVTLDGETEQGVVLVRNSTDSGWEAVSNSFTMSIRTESPSGSPEAMAPNGAMRVPVGGRILVNGTDYLPQSSVNVFAVPRNVGAVVVPGASRVMHRMIMRAAAAGAVYIGSAPVDAAGGVSATFTVPTGIDLGSYVLQINGVSATDQVRSVNLLMDVIAGAPTSRSGLIREAAFYKGGSASLSATGRMKLQGIVDAIPVGAQQVQVYVVGVATSAATVDENLDLARDRAKRIASYLEAQGVAGEYTVSVATTFTVEGKERSVAVDSAGKVLDRAGNAGADDGAKALGLDKPAQSSSGKPLTTVSVSFQAPVGT